jgi:hypothetical protein
MLPFHTKVNAAVGPVSNSLVDSPCDVQNGQAEQLILQQHGLRTVATPWMSLAHHPECVDLPIRSGMFEQAGLPAAAAIFAVVGIEHVFRVIRADFAGLTAERRRRKQKTQNNKQSYAFHKAHLSRIFCDVFIKLNVGVERYQGSVVLSLLQNNFVLAQGQLDFSLLPRADAACATLPGILQVEFRTRSSSVLPISKARCC